MSELKACFKCGENGAPTMRCGDECGRPCAPYSVECVECYSVSSPEYDTKEEAAAWWDGYQTAAKDGVVTKNMLTEQAAEYENRIVECRNWQQQGVKRVEELERTVDDLRGELAQSDRASDAARISELEAERDKLRAALEKIAEHPCGVIADAGSMKKIALEALKGGE